eukprot:Sspe_Gene.116419::Locus_105648_Transcript_1_1_Confidence_1.000_Length_699::g.116419::m.116419
MYTACTRPTLLALSRLLPARRGVFTVRVADIALPVIGRCLCGGTEVEVSQLPLSTYYCHCTLCQRTTSAPFEIGAVVPRDGVHIVRGSAALKGYPSSPTGVRLRCGTCGTFVGAENGDMWCMATALYIDPVSGAIPLFLKPDKHIFYSSRVVDVPDGLPKYESFAVDFATGAPHSPLHLP